MVGYASLVPTVFIVLNSVWKKQVQTYWGFFIAAWAIIPKDRSLTLK